MHRLPFTTSTLQQEAAKTLNFSTQKTMRLAQQLYEGVDIKGQWYGWSDQLSAYGFHSNLTGSRCRQQESILENSMEKTMFPQAGKTVKKEQKIQDAHEAIRPTDITRTAGQ